MYPSREEFSELIYYISELKHTYSQKIDEQSTKINEQSIVIEELLWQVRELSDKIRQVNQWKNDVDRVISDSRRKFDDMSRSTCVCRYENHFPRNRIITSRQSSNVRQQTQKQNQQLHNEGVSKRKIGADKTDKSDGRDMSDDVYETIEFSDSSHIYTEPVKIEIEQQNEYGALRKINVKTTPTTTTATVRQTSMLNRKPTSSSKGNKKSMKTRNLQKFPAMQDVSKAVSSSDSNEEACEEEKVELRVKSGRNSRGRGNSKQVCALDIDGVRDHISEQFIKRRDVSGLLINFDYLRSRAQSEINGPKTSM